MSKFITTPLLITEYYNSLISQLDIYTEEKIKRYKEKGLPVKRINNRCSCGKIVFVRGKTYPEYGVEMLENPYEEQTYTIDRDEMLERYITTKSEAEEYMNKVREKAIDEIIMVQDENLKFYNENQEKFKTDRENETEEKFEEFKSQLFANRFCFLVEKQPNNICRFGDDREMPLFNLHLVNTDFYLRESDIEYIRKKIDSKYEIKHPPAKLDNRFLLANLVLKYIEKSIDVDENGYEIIDIKQKTLFEIEHIEVGSYKNQNLSFKETEFSFDKDIDLSSIKSLSLQAEVKITDLSALLNLEYLSINCIKLCQSPFQNLQKLIKIELYNCDVSEFDFDSLNSLTSLQIIDIDLDTSRNEKNVQSISFKFDLNMLINLKWLDMKFNQQNEVNNLEIITDDSYNQLTYVRVNKTIIDFSKQLYLPELKCLDISNVDLSEQINEQSFNGMSNLVKLNLNDTNLTNVDFLVTDRLGNLKLLDLSINKITVSKRAFSKLKKLKKLNLRYNQIQELIPGVFEGLECLEQLDLTSKNINIESIDKAVFDVLKCLKKLYIRDYKSINVNVDHLKRDGLYVY